MERPRQREREREREGVGGGSEGVKGDERHLLNKIATTYVMRAGDEGCA